MKKQSRTQNIFWILSAVFAFGFFLTLALPSIALGAPTPPPGCSPHKFSLGAGPGAEIPGVYDCGNVPNASRQGVSISRGGQSGNCVAACTDKIAGGIVLNYGISSGEPYCFGAEKSQTCSVTVSDKRIRLDVKDSSVEQAIEKDECDGFVCTLVNLGISLITFLPVSMVTIILWMLNWMIGTITALLGVLMKAVILATLSIPVVPGKLGGLDAIQKGWEFSRNFVNLLFLLFAVFTGLATILRLENYQAKKVLPMLLMMALLVNFSGVLVGVVVDFSNLLTKFFIERLGTWGGIKDVLSKVNDSVLSQFGAFIKITSNPATHLSNIATPIAELMIMLIFFSLLLIALFVAMLVFVVRIAILWVLVIMAPFAFAAYALPGTRKFWNEWIQNLVAWSIVGIPLSFFLYIASFLVVSLSTNHVFEPKNIEDVGYPNLTAAITNILEPVAVLIVIVYGLMFSKKMAPAAAQGLINWGTTAGMGLATGGAAFLGSRALSTGIGQKILQKGMSARPMSWEELKTKNAGEARWWKRQVNSAGFGVSQALLRPTAFAISQASVSTREWNLSQNKEEIAAMETKAKKTDAVGKLGLLRNRTLTQNQRYAVLSTAAEAGELKALTDESVVGEGNTLSRGEAQEFYKRVASGKSDKDKKMEKQMRLMYAGSDMMTALDETKDAITKNADAATKTANGLTADDKALGYANTTQKTVAEAKNEEELKLLSKSVRNSDDFKAAVHDFWRGSQLEAGAKEFGRAFIQTLTEDAASRGSDHYYQVVRRGGTDANPVMRPRNTDLPRFLAGNLAQGLGAIPLEGASGPAELKKRTAIANLVARMPILEEPAKEFARAQQLEVSELLPRRDFLKTKLSDLRKFQNELKGLKANPATSPTVITAKEAEIKRSNEYVNTIKEEIQRRQTEIDIAKAAAQDEALKTITTKLAFDQQYAAKRVWDDVVKEHKTKRQEIPTETVT